MVMVKRAHRGRCQAARHPAASAPDQGAAVGSGQRERDRSHPSFSYSPLLKYGYARVSTNDQNSALQLAALKKAGCRQTFTDEGISGAITKRPALTRCLNTLKPGDTLTVWKLDRLGRSLRDLIAILDDLKRRGVKFRSLTEAIDTETPTGRAMWQMIGVLAELERSLIGERTRAGLSAARSRGVKFGRKPKLSAQQIHHARRLIEQGEQPEAVAQSLKVGRSTLYRALQRAA